MRRATETHELPQAPFAGKSIEFKVKLPNSKDN